MGRTNIFCLLLFSGYAIGNDINVVFWEMIDFDFDNFKFLMTILFNLCVIGMFICHYLGLCVIGVQENEKD